MTSIGSNLHLLLAVSLFAQTTALLTGIVTSAGKPMPGVVVTVRSQALQGTRTTTTSDGGAYNFAALPPGQYRVAIGQTGRNAELRLAQANGRISEALKKD